MPREPRIFSYVVDPPTSTHHQRASVAVTVLLEVTLAAGLLLVPILAPEALPASTAAIAAFVTAPEPPPPPPAPPRVHESSPSAQPATEPIPVAAPDAIAPEPVNTPAVGPPRDELLDGPGVIGLPDAFGGVVGRFDATPPSPPPPPPPPIPRIGGNVRPPQKTRHVAPVYPPIAREAQIEGFVVIEATIDERGRVTDATVLRGHPMLDAEALRAVRQWEFTPTLLNGMPTAVIMSVTVTFRLR